MNSIPKIGLIGVGGYGERHLEAIRNLEQTREVQLIAVADPNISQNKECASLLKSKVRIYENYHEMLLNEPTLDAVSLVTPIPCHFKMVKTCLERDLFVYLEKPPVPSLCQLEKLIAADTNLKVAVGFQLIESDWSRQLKRWISGGELGEIAEIRAAACWPRPDSYYQRSKWAGRMSIDGEPVFDGPATNALSHLIHNIMFLAATGSEEFEQPIEVQGELYRARPIESYDVACLRGRFSSGIRFFAALTHATEKPLPFQMEIIGSKGWARVSGDGQLVESNLGTVHCTDEIADTMLRSYRHFIGYLKGERKRPSTLLRDTRGYSLATNAMLQSSGGIHKIDETWIRRTADGIYSVQGLHENIADSLRNPLLFSERCLPWAVKTPMVLTAELAKKTTHPEVVQPLMDEHSFQN